MRRQKSAQNLWKTTIICDILNHFMPKGAFTMHRNRIKRCLDEYINMHHTENQSKDSICSSELHVCKYGS